MTVDAFAMLRVQGDNPEALHAHWDAFLAHNDKPPRHLVAGGELVAYLNHGRWVADCPNCNGGIAATIKTATGCCLDCGSEFVLKFPGVAERKQLAALLDGVPQQQQSWDRHRGQTLKDFKARLTLLRGV